MATDTLDPYAVLGVSPHATRQEVASAHRRLAKRHHPDIDPGPGSAERMRRINDAWRILSNPARRARYDATRRAGTGTTAPHWAPRTAGAWPARQAYGTVTPRTRRPPRPEPVEPSFGDRPWVTFVAAGLMALLFLIGTFLGSLPR